MVYYMFARAQILHVSLWMLSLETLKQHKQLKKKAFSFIHQICKSGLPAVNSYENNMACNITFSCFNIFGMFSFGEKKYETCIATHYLIDCGSKRKSFSFFFFFF